MFRLRGPVMNRLTFLYRLWSVSRLIIDSMLSQLGPARVDRREQLVKIYPKTRWSWEPIRKSKIVNTEAYCVPSESTRNIQQVAVSFFCIPNQQSPIRCIREGNSAILRSSANTSRWLAIDERLALTQNDVTDGSRRKTFNSSVDEENRARNTRKKRAT